MSGSKLFRRNRSIGHICDHVPAAVRFAHRRQENIIITSVGRTFHVYSCNHFRLICVSGLHPENITCITADNRFIYTSAGSKIFAWRAGNIVRHNFVGHTKKVHLMLPFGVQHLISIDTDSMLKVWNVQNETEFCEIPFSNAEFRITAICHPPTYLNKILLGSEQGLLQLWNIKKSALVHTFQRFDTRIDVLEPAPAMDVVALGLADGMIILLNLKYDEMVMQFKQDWGPVTSITFRTDNHPIMITGSTNGQIVAWNLEEKVIFAQFQAHTDRIASAVCMTNEPLLFTSSSDNSIKLWIFDLPDGRSRLLRIREGHAAPPLRIKYYGTSGNTILSAGEDSSLRAMSTITETLNKSFGRASYNRKASKKRKKTEEDPFQMPAIVDFTSECTRENEWDNIAAIHSGLVVTTTWSFKKCKMGELKLVPEQYQNKNRTDFTVEATCLSLTHCGNFVIIGYSAGDVERFNIQSGIHRQQYGDKIKKAHQIAVRGVHSDNLNQVVISGDSDGIVKFWNFSGSHTRFPIGKLKLDAGISMFRAHSENALLCAVMDDFTVQILDCDTKTVVRKFSGHKGAITDVTFSADSRWLISASMDSTVKVYDIPSAYLIDHFEFDVPCVSLTISPTGDFLATAHVNRLGIYTWANKSLFTHISLNAIDPLETPPKIDLPVSTDACIEKSTIPIDAQIDSNADTYQSPLQLSKQLITMSSLAASRWQNILNLDIVKKRNRPRIPISKPKKANFFLPTVAGLDFQFDLSDQQKNSSNGDAGVKFLQPNHFSNLTKFGQLLDRTVKSNRFEDCIKHITSLGPSMIDFEVKSLDPHASGNDTVMHQFLKMINTMLAANTNFELAQSYLALFLKEHSRYIVSRPVLHDYLCEIEATQNDSWKRLEDKLIYGIAVATESRLFVN